jgi:prepilin signal peptidase PulO-like enzyme (type II secretory pathway)
VTTRTVIAATVGSATFASAGLLASTSPLTLARLAVLGGALAAVSIYDLTQRRLPNRIVLPAAGDVKLALLLVLGLDGSALRALALGLALAALAGGALVARHGRTALRASLPLAPFIAAGALVVVVV